MTEIPNPTPASVTASETNTETQQALPLDDILLEQPFTGYEVTERVAQGGMGMVFRAKDLRMDRDVAIKVLIPDLEHHENAVEEFFNEARNVARLRHPGIVRGLDVGRAGKYFFFAMEYVRGETLAAKLERLERGKLPEEKTLDIIKSIAIALQYIFENGLVHRDIKPSNILLSTDGSVKLCDLGVAREVTCATPEAFVKGSPAYASPEQARGDFNIDIRADLYGLGCVWFHMLTGLTPYRGVTPAEILRKHLEAPVPNPRDEDIRISAATSELVQCLLRKDRDERPRVPQEFLNRLAQHPFFKTEAAQETDMPDTTDEENTL